MKKNILVIIFIIVSSQEVISQSDFSLKEKFVIGGNDLNTPEYIFRGPNNLVQDSKGRIYIVDKGATEINIFNSSGIYLKTIGKNGKGPGEFLEIGSLDMIDDTLIVFDGINQRFTKLTFDGITETFTIDVNELGFMNVKKVTSNSDKYLIFLSAKKFRDAESQSLIYKFDKSFSFEGRSFGEVKDLWNTEKDFMTYQAYLRNAISTDMINDKLYLTPIFYENYIMELDIRNGTSRRILVNDKAKYKSYISYNLKDFNKKIPNKMLFSGIFGKFVIQAVNRSLGLYYENGIIYHFFIEKISKKNSALSLNIFSKEDGFLNKIMLKKFNSHPVNTFKVLDYKNGKLFLTDISESPIVEVYELNLKFNH